MSEHYCKVLWGDCPCPRVDDEPCSYVGKKSSRQQPVEKIVSIPIGEDYLRNQYKSFYEQGRADFQREAMGKINSMINGDDMVFIAYKSIIAAIQSLPVKKGG